MKEIRFRFVFAALLGCFVLSGLNARAEEMIVRCVAFYNLENVFDTIHDEGKNDYEYLPDGGMKWTKFKYEQKIQNMNLEHSVIMTGNVTNVADYLSAMDVFVFPSLFEGLPLSILEVQANGLPCVISDSVPKDVFLTDLIHPLSLKDSKKQWIDKILTMQRTDSAAYNQMLQQSEYTVEKAMAKVYRIYDKE